MEPLVVEFRCTITEHTAGRQKSAVEQEIENKENQETEPWLRDEHSRDAPRDAPRDEHSRRERLALGTDEECHCDHVKQLMLEVDALKARSSCAGDDTWARSSI